MLKVFMSYAKEDRALVEPYFEKLADARFSPWMDERSILPGADWSHEIQLAMQRSEVVILFCSPRSVSKTGFVQAEARMAIEKLKLSPEGFITVIPAMLEPCEVPKNVRDRVQFVDLTREGAWDRLLQSLQVAAFEREIVLEEGIMMGPFTVFSETLAETRDVVPKYDLYTQFPRFESTQKPAAALALSRIFSGEAYAGMAKQRADVDNWADASEDAWWTELANTFTAEVQVVFANDCFVSTLSTIATYYRGAAHGNTGFRTANYSLDDGVKPVRLASFFTDAAQGFARLSELCIVALQREMWRRSGQTADAASLEWIKEGAGPDEKNFQAVTYDDQGITVYFAPYEVAAYAFNTFVIMVPYFDLLDVLRPNGIHSRLIRPGI